MGKPFPRRPGFRRGYSVLERERFGLDWRDPPSPPPPGPEVSALVSGLLRRLGLDQDLWHRQVLDEWPALVGPQLACRTRPGRIENRVLTLYVTSSAWLNELCRYGQRQILAKLQDRFGRDRIRSLRLQLDPDLNSGPRA